jgi:HIRAN domain
MVAGVRYDGREDIIRAYVAQGDDVLFMRERDNEHSRNAILIRLPNGMGIGYVPEECARDMAPLLDRGQKYQAFVKKILSGGRYLLPVIIANFYRPDANVEGIKTEVQGLLSIAPIPSVEKPRHRDDTWVPPSRNKSGCLIGGVSIITFAILYVSHGCADIFRRLMSKFPTH